MPNIIEITSFDAPELDVFARLTESQLRSRQQQEKGIFIAEGLTVISHALNAGCLPISFLMERKHIIGKARDILEKCENTPVYTADSTILANLTGFELTRGVLCAMRRPALPDISGIVENARRVAVLENIVDPTNVGAIFRCAAALSIDAVLLSPSCCDPLNRRSVRVSMGTVFQIPWTRFSAGSTQWSQEGINQLHELGFKAAALALSEDAISIENEALCSEEKLAIFLGSEGNGLQKETIAQCDYNVIIPMSHGVDSLNVAAASAIAFWQLRAK